MPHTSSSDAGVVVPIPTLPPAVAKVVVPVVESVVNAAVVAFSRAEKKLVDVALVVMRLVVVAFVAVKLVNAAVIAFTSVEKKLVDVALVVMRFVLVALTNVMLVMDT